MRGKATQLFRNKAKDKMVSPNLLEAVHGCSNLQRSRPVFSGLQLYISCFVGFWWGRVKLAEKGLSFASVGVLHLCFGSMQRFSQPL